MSKKERKKPSEQSLAVGRKRDIARAAIDVVSSSGKSERHKKGTSARGGATCSRSKLVWHIAIPPDHGRFFPSMTIAAGP